MDNSDFNLTDEELLQLNDWTTSIAKAMGESDCESWDINVKFTFTNMGTVVVATCGSNFENSLVIREIW
ncbi:MAG: hypothetical protein PHN84_12540 [Desulfuromonadaceae bacterium]|nr:hypothetical protein [Desulfuromonadaceae bacterium]MDD2855796.1 hypothetical protein [Desulfuromonadaceae bacterium]